MTQILEPPPYTPVRPVVDVYHGVEVVDPYRWLEDGDSPETRAWLDDQTRHTRAYLDQIPGRETIRRRVTELLSIEAYDTPHQIGDKCFFIKREAGQEQFCICLREGEDGEDQVLVDPLARGCGSAVSVRIVAVSNDGRYLAYGVRTGGEDSQTVEIFDVARRRALPDGLPHGFCLGFAFAGDGESYFYSYEPVERGPYRRTVRQHVIGTALNDDEEVFFAGDEQDIRVYVQGDRTGRYVGLTVVCSREKCSIDFWLLEQHNPSALRKVAEHMESPFMAKIAHGKVLVLTNWHARNRQVIEIDPLSPDMSNWRTLIPECELRILEFTLAQDRIWVRYTENIASRIDVFDLAGRRLGTVPLPAAGSVMFCRTNPVWTDEFFFRFQSFSHPVAILRYPSEIESSKPWAGAEAQRSETPPALQLHVDQVWYPSRDGTRVPMYVVHREGLALNGNLPTVLTGYGGFGKAVTPQYSQFVTFLLERGCVFALANLRGGSELGEEWHEAAMRHNRQKAFDDFIAAGEWLTQSGYTNPDKLAIVGGSNSGLLVGAVLTQRPELFRAVLCLGPLLDMLRYHRFGYSRAWVNEFGTADYLDDFTTLHAYSPYHRIQDERGYPAVMVVSGDADLRCDPMHARKMVARLQAANISDGPILLDYTSMRGHMPVMPLSERIRALSDRLAFICDQLGIPLE